MSNQDEEKQLLQKAQAGDANAFASLIQPHERLIYNIAYRMLLNPEDAKDLSQEILIKIYHNLNRFDGKSAFSTWIYRIATNRCIDELRKRKGKETYSIDESLENGEAEMQKQYTSSAPTPEESLLQKERQALLQDAIRQLSDDHKLMIVLRDLEGFSYTEIAETADMSIGTVKSRIARARIQLKNILQKNREQSTPVSRPKRQKGGETL